MRFECRCEAPAASPNPRSAGTCNRCLGLLAPRWTSNAQTVSAFYARLAEALFGYGPDGELLTEPWFDAFVDQAKARELAGRDKFGHRYLTRDNRVEALEEWTDGSNYLFFDSLQELRAEGDDADIDLVLDVAYHAALAYRSTLRLAAKRRSSTGPGMDE